MAARKKTAQETELIGKSKKYLPAGHFGNIALDCVITDGKGGRVWDASGNEYVDYVLGSGPMLVGHSHPEVLEAVHARLDRGTTFFAVNDAGILLAEEIIKAVPCAEKLRYTSSGTEATAYAMRAVRSFRKRERILKFEGGFHGMNDYALMSMAPKRRVNSPEPLPDSAGIPSAVRGEVLIAPFNDLDAATALIERHHDELGGVIVEPFQRVISPKPGFLQGLREVTAKYKVPLIFDEIVTGFRFAYGGAQEFYGVTPDLCTLGKVIGGGFPLAAVVGKAAILDHFDKASVGEEGFMPQIGTLSGNPIAAAAGLATLKILKRPGTYEKIHATGKTLMEGFRKLFREAGVPVQVTGEGVLFDLVFTDKPIVDYWSTAEADNASMNRFNQLLLERGVLKGNTKFYVSLAHNDEDVKKTLDAAGSALAALKSSKAAA
jgi:glutamate-1-semialdehyde 2,1-aminomutase